MKKITWFNFCWSNYYIQYIIADILAFIFIIYHQDELSGISDYLLVCSIPTMALFFIVILGMIDHWKRFNNTQS